MLFATPRGARSAWPVSLDRLADAFLEAISDVALRECVTLSHHEGKLHVALHPAEEDVEFWFDGERLWCSAKTSSCGPGYHAYLVEILERIAVELRLDWIIDEEQESWDETQYWTNRDFVDLQAEMSRLFRAIAQQGSGDGEKSRFMLSMPIGYPSVVGMEGSAMTPLGFRSRTWLGEVGASKDVPVVAASTYFSWWNRNIDALFWKRYALVLCWTEVNWNVPWSAQDRERYERVLACFARARTCDPTIVIPEAEVAEIEELLADDAECDENLASDTSRIGYLRHMLHRTLLGGWSIDVPGHWHYDWEDDNTTFVCWGHSITVRVSSFALHSDPAKSALEMAGEPRGVTDSTDLIDDRGEQPPGWAIISFQSDDEGSYWRLSGHRGKTNGLGIVTICFDNKSDLERVLAVWRSFKHPKTE